MTTSTDSAQQDPPTSEDADPGAALAEACAALPLAGPPQLLADGPHALVVSDEGADPGTRVFHLPQHEAGAAAHERRTQFLPYLRGHLSPAVPLPELGSTAGSSPGYTVAPYLPGRNLHSSTITDRNEARIARDLGRFLAELHAYPAERAQSFGVPGLREWRQELDGVRRRCLSALRPRIGITDTARLRRWWTATLAADAWDFAPGLAHANLAPEHLLLDGEARSLQTVLGWSRAVVADPALDVAVLSRHYGADFAWLVMDAYRHAGATANAAFLTRVRQRSALLPFLDWDRSRAPGSPAPPAATERLIERLRSGPLLSSDTP